MDRDVRGADLLSDTPQGQRTRSFTLEDRQRRYGDGGWRNRLRWWPGGGLPGSLGTDGDSRPVFLRRVAAEQKRSSGPAHADRHDGQPRVGDLTGFAPAGHLEHPVHEMVDAVQATAAEVSP